MLTIEPLPAASIGRSAARRQKNVPSRSATITAAPSDANRAQIAAPIPDPPPVTNATRPSSTIAPAWPTRGSGQRDQLQPVLVEVVERAVGQQQHLRRFE